MFGETTIFYIKIWNHPIETSMYRYKWLFGVPGVYIICMVDFPAWMLMAKVSALSRLENGELALWKNREIYSW